MEHRPTLSDLIQAEQMAADIFLLFALDNAWTMYLKEAPSVPPHDEAMLRVLADRISWLVDRLAHSAAFIDRWAKERAADLDETFRNQLVKLPDADRRNVEEVIAKRGGLSAAIADSCNTIRLEAPLNRRDNDEKMDRISSGPIHGRRYAFRARVRRCGHWNGHGILRRPTRLPCRLCGSGKVLVPLAYTGSPAGWGGNWRLFREKRHLTFVTR
jgi:hypothetical protein